MRAQTDLFAPADLPEPAPGRAGADAGCAEAAAAGVAVPPPGDGACGGQWNAYVAAGPSKAERRARLALCPAALRAEVESHVRTVFAIRARQADPAFRAWAAEVRRQQADARRAAGQRKPSDPA